MTAVRYFYYLGHHPWRTDADGQGAFTLPPSCVGAVDLRTIPDQSVPAVEREPSLFATREPLNSAYHLLGVGDCREILATGSLRDLWQSVTGYRPDGERLVDLLWDHLLAGDPDGLERCRPAVPRRDLQLALSLPGHSVVKAEPFRWGHHRHTAALRRLLRAQLLEERRDAMAGRRRRPVKEDGRIVGAEVDRDFHRRVAQALIEKYSRHGIAAADLWEDLRPPGWSRHETPLPHDTTIADDFNRYDAPTLGSSAEGWAWQEIGSWSISAMAARSGNVSDTRCQPAIDLSSADHYAEAYISGNANALPGIGVRSDIVNLTWYHFRSQPAGYPGTLDLFKRVAGSWTNLGSKAWETIPATFRLTADGSQLTATRDGVEVFGVTDTAIADNLRASFRAATGGGTYDNFQAGDLALGRIYTEIGSGGIALGGSALVASGHISGRIAGRVRVLSAVGGDVRARAAAAGALEIKTAVSGGLLIR